MVAGVNMLTTVFSASSPFIVADGSQTSLPAKTAPTLLTPKQDSAQVADIANVFTPAANISALASQTASVILTEQAREKPIILQNPNPPLDNSPLGNLDIYEELLTTPLVPENSRNTEDNSFKKPSLQQDSFGKIENPNVISDTGSTESFIPAAERTPFGSEEQFAPREKAAFTSAIAAYQQASPALTGAAPALSIEA